MQKIKTKIISVLILILFIGLAFAMPYRINTKQIRHGLAQNTHARDTINCLVLNAFLKEHFPDLDIHGGPSNLSQIDCLAMEEDYDIFFRFLSILSGKDTPFNMEYDTYIVKNPQWICLPENIELAKWYEIHQDEINCEVFYDYYRLIKGIREGPKIRIDDCKEYSKELEVYYDSLYEKMNEFEHKYYKFLEKDSLR